MGEPPFPAVAFLATPGMPPCWLSRPPSGEFVRAQASDLSAARRLRTQIRRHRAMQSHTTEPPKVLFDVEFHLAADARTARHELGARSRTVQENITYVGTSPGLAGLIADMMAAEVADGVILRPLSDELSNRLATLIVVEVMPVLQQIRGALAPVAMAPA